MIIIIITIITIITISVPARAEGSRRVLCRFGEVLKGGGVTSIRRVRV